MFSPLQALNCLMLSRQPAWLKTQIWRSGVIDKRYRDRKMPQRNLRLNLTGQGYLLRQSNRSCRVASERLRRSPSVPRGAPQRRHMISVEGDASSIQSKTMPSESQFMQTILKSGRRSDLEFVIGSLEK